MLRIGTVFMPRHSIKTCPVTGVPRVSSSKASCVADVINIMPHDPAK